MKNQNDKIHTFACEVVDADSMDIYAVDKYGIEYTINVPMMEFFITAQNMGHFPDGKDFEDTCCTIQWEDANGHSKSKVATYSDLLNGLTFGTEEKEEICEEVYRWNATTIYKVNMTKVYKMVYAKRSPLPGYAVYQYAEGFKQGLEENVPMKWLDESWYFTNEIAAKERALLCLEVDAIMLKDEVERLKKIQKESKPYLRLK